MPKFEVVTQGVISAPPMAVYKAVMDEYSGVTHLWLPDLEFKPRDGNPMDLVGSICDSTARSHGLTGKFSEKVTGIEPAKSIAFDISGDFTGTETWTFEPEEEGKTKAMVVWKGASNKRLLSLVSPFVDIGKELHNSRMKFLQTLENTLNKKS